MKTFKIATKTNEIAETAHAKYERVFVSGGGLCIETKITDGDDFIVGGKVRFEKYAIGNNDQSLRVCDEDCLITNIVEKNGYKYIYFEYPYIKPLTIAAFHKIESPDGYKYKFYFCNILIKFILNISFSGLLLEIITPLYVDNSVRCPSSSISSGVMFVNNTIFLSSYT